GGLPQCSETGGQLMVNHYFITGTDTDVGKTRVAEALLCRARRQGLSTAAVKPVAAGCELVEGRLCNDDALRLQRWCQPALNYAEVNPIALAPAIAPHIAAAEAGLKLQAADLAAATAKVLVGRADFALVEGAGGWRVPLNDSETLADLACALQLPVILVVGVRLGCINHALLSAEAIVADGLVLAGWVANVVDPNASVVAQNIAAIDARIGAPCLGVIPWQPAPDTQMMADLLMLPDQL
ncbi:MAG TPA: dethiobiotin synthase, partial [Cellvibrionaceae bacterium]